MLRRSFLTCAGVGVPALAGCVESSDGADGETSVDNGDTNETDPGDGTDNNTSNGSDNHGHDVETRYRRGTAPPAGLEFEPHEPTDNLGPEDHEYDESAEVVRIDYRNTTGEMSFEEFAETRTRRAVQTELRSRFDEEGIDSGLRVSRIRGRDKQRLQESDIDLAVDEYDQIAQVSHVTIYDENWEVVYDPDVAFKDVVKVVPARFDTKTEFASREFTAEVAVVCFRGAEREIEDEE